jgi:hypothetical protein
MILFNIIIIINVIIIIVIYLNTISTVAFICNFTDTFNF